MKYKTFMTGIEFNRFRLEKDLSQSQIATILGVSPVTVKSWEHERRNIPKTVNNFLRLSIAQVPSDKLKLIALKIKNNQEL